MSLYGSRVINIEKIWLPIPGEGRQVAVKIKLRLTATPDDPVKGKFFAAFNEQVLEADTQKELNQKLRAAAAATGLPIDGSGGCFQGVTEQCRATTKFC